MDEKLRRALEYAARVHGDPPEEVISKFEKAIAEGALKKQDAPEDIEYWENFFRSANIALQKNLK